MCGLCNLFGFGGRRNNCGCGWNNGCWNNCRCNNGCFNGFNSLRHIPASFIRAGATPITRTCDRI